MASIQAERLVKRYNPDAPAVTGIDFSIQDGEFVAILGPSGCGKRSTMRMIAGLETFTEGTIRFDGKPVNDSASTSATSPCPLILRPLPDQHGLREHGVSAALPR
jgi:ABC-type sugar transport system ATPase subunit